MSSVLLFGSRQLNFYWAFVVRPDDTSRTGVALLYFNNSIQLLMKQPDEYWQ
jgi:hypothetical protein